MWELPYGISIENGLNDGVPFCRDFDMVVFQEKETFLNIECTLQKNN